MISAQQEIIEKIIFDGRGATNKQITKNILNQWRGSDTIRDMQEAQNYYLVKNSSIQKKSREYVDPDGNIVHNMTLSNVKLSSGFVRSSVQQKVNYAFGKPFVLEVKHKDETAENSKRLEIYKAEWLKFIDDKIRRIVKRIANDAVNKGIGWAYVYIDTIGQLQITDIEPETIYPAWADRSHTILDAVVRDCIIVEYEVDIPKEVNKVEFWDRNIVEKYIDIGNDLIPDIEADFTQKYNSSEAVVFSHMKLRDDNIGWNKVPFISLKGNEDELPLLNLIKDFVDAYDRLNSKSVDTLIDDIDAVLVVKNVSPEIGGLTKTRQILQNSRVVAVEGDGDARFEKVNTDIDAVQAKLGSLYKNINQFSSSVDTQDVKMGTNNSGAALKAMYQDLDTNVNGLELEFRAFIENIKYFFDIWLEFKKIGTAEEWSDYKVIVTLDRDMLINQSELITDAVKLSSLVSQETLDNYNPAVVDHATEQARREKEEKIKLTELDIFRKAQKQIELGEGGDLSLQPQV